MDVLDLIIYPKDYSLHFNPVKVFTKWALVEVTSFENIPTGMENYLLPAGEYAVFESEGRSDDNSIFS